MSELPSMQKISLGAQFHTGSIYLHSGVRKYLPTRLEISLVLFCTRSSTSIDIFCGENWTGLPLQTSYRLDDHTLE